jgi:hypothetical protein
MLETADFINDDDPFDEISTEATEMGIIIRTDYSDEDSWNTFCLRLKDGEKEFMDAKTAAETNEAPPESAPPASGDQMDGIDSEGDDSEDEAPSIFKIVNPSSSQERAIVRDISNITALRLLTDVDIRLCPSVPDGSTRLKHPDRLIDYDGWQEVYSGKHLWIYDTKSNSDQCVRLISHAGETYGTAT